MPLAGKGFLAIWNDLEPDQEREWLAWHTYEHMSERVGVEGFLAGRRYVDPARASHRYFTLYVSRNLATFSSPPYLERLNNPTPWTQKTAPLFRNFMRGACQCLASVGAGVGGALATFRLSIDDPTRLRDAKRAQALVEAVAGNGRTVFGLTAAHLGAADAGVTGVPTKERAARGADKEPIFEAVLLVEATGRAVLDGARREIVAALAAADLGVRIAFEAVYDLEIALVK